MWRTVLKTITVGETCAFGENLKILTVQGVADKQ